MLCEERGYFLEIVDVVRGFGLTILKGIMETRNDKIWAHFIVEVHTFLKVNQQLRAYWLYLQFQDLSDSSTQLSSALKNRALV